jgi:trimeric autotransporter adhesin
LIKAERDISFNGGSIQIETFGQGSRGIICEGNLLSENISLSINCSGNGLVYTDSTGTANAYHSTCLKVDGSIVLNGGSIGLLNSGSGGKGVRVSGDFEMNAIEEDVNLSIQTSGTNVTISSGSGGGGPGGGPGGGNQGVYDKSKALKANGNVTINGGTFVCDSNDDGIKSESSITINGGNISILDSYEGLEAPLIVINNGDISIFSTDDGINATGSSGGESNDGSLLEINGGYCFISASGGDAIDSNGDVVINDGLMVVHGPQSSPEVGMDYNGTATINGGFIVISGTNSNMTQSFGSASAQRSLTLKTTQSIAANTIVHLEDADGNEIFTFKPMRPFYSIVFSSPLITQGTSYTLYTGGSSTGTTLNGLVSGGTYSPGTNEATFNVTNVVTTVNF